MVECRAQDRLRSARVLLFHGSLISISRHLFFSERSILGGQLLKYRDIIIYEFNDVTAGIHPIE